MVMAGILYHVRDEGKTYAIVRKLFHQIRKIYLKSKIFFMSYRFRRMLSSRRYHHQSNPKLHRGLIKTFLGSGC